MMAVNRLNQMINKWFKLFKKSIIHNIKNNKIFGYSLILTRFADFDTRREHTSVSRSVADTL